MVQCTMGSARNRAFTDGSSSAFLITVLSQRSPRRRAPPVTRDASPCGDRPPASPALAPLATLTSADPLPRLEAGPSRQQRRGLFPMEPRRHRRLEILEHRPSLLTARRHHRPDPLTPPVPPLAPRPLGDPPVDHHEPDRLL